MQSKSGKNPNVDAGNSLEIGAKPAQSTCICLHKQKGIEGSNGIKQGMTQEDVLFIESWKESKADRATPSCLPAEEIQGS
jgi:hypothetical protein